MVNQATHEYKEEIKVGYNLQPQGRADDDLGAVAVAALFDPALFGMVAAAGAGEFLRHVGLSWLAIGLGGLLFRTVHLFFLKDVQTGLVWMTKIITDPFHDIKLYYKAPLTCCAAAVDSMTPIRRIVRWPGVIGPPRSRRSRWSDWDGALRRAAKSTGARASPAGCAA